MFKPFSNGVIRFYDVQAFIVPPLSIVCCAVLVLVVFRHTPRQMGALKWYIIASSICSLVCELLLGLGHPLPLLPYPYMLGGGILPVLNFSQDGYHAYAGILLFSFIVMLYANAAMFVFRFGQTVDSAIVKWMAQPRYAVGIAASIISAFSIGLLFPLNFLTISPDDVRASARANDTALFNMIKDRPFIGANIDINLPFVTFAVVFTCFAIVNVIALVGSALGCQYFARFRQHSRLSERTLRLYKILANALVLDLALTALTMLLPGLLAAVSFLAGFDGANEMVIVALCCAEWYPIATNALILWYVKPYRDGLRRTLRLTRGMAPRKSVSTTVTLFVPRIK